MKNKFVILLLCVFLLNQSVCVFGKGNEGASEWARTDIMRAEEKGLVPEELKNDYKKPVTREEFCALIVNMLGKTDSRIIEGEGTENIYYSDTSREEIIKASALGIVSGKGNNKFDPNGSITRQEAARMLYMASTIGKRYSELQNCFSDKLKQMNDSVIMPHIFKDGYKIQNWAQESINYCYMYGIMQGNDNNMFDVEGTYSREQAVVTILRLYDLYKEGNISAPQREYLYAKRDIKNGAETWGYINEKNQWIIEPDHKERINYAYPFEGDYALIDLGSASGLRVINKKGDIVHSGYTHGVRFGSIVSFEGDEGTTNLNTGQVIGEPIFNLNKMISGVGEALVAVRDSETGLYGYYNYDGELIIPKKFKEAYVFCNGRAIVKYNDEYESIDRFGRVTADFNINLNNGEYVHSAVGDICIVKKHSEYDDEFCAVVKAGKGVVLNSGNGREYAELLTGGNILVKEGASKYSIYDNEGELVFTNDNIVDINYEASVNVYIVTPYFQNNKRYDKILTAEGKEIVTADADKYSVIGNGTFCAFDDNEIKVYDNRGNVVSTINTSYDIDEVYCDNGVVFVTDKEGNLNGYTYMGNKII